MENLQNVLSSTNVTLSSIVSAIGSESVEKLKLNQKSRKRLLLLLSENSNDSPNRSIVIDILKILSRNRNLIESLVLDGPSIASICDKLLYFCGNNSKNDETKNEIINVIELLINNSETLKSVIAPSIHEYLYGAFRPDVDPLFLAKSIKLLVTVITHHKDNRHYFAVNSTIQHVQGIIGYVHNTTDPMGQAFAIEFLWRLLLGMKERRNSKDIDECFGTLKEPLLMISPENFCSGIREFLRIFNNNNQNIMNTFISDLFVGGVSISGNNELDIGFPKIVFWINKDSKWSHKNVKTDLIIIKKEDIIGIGRENNMFIIVLSQRFNTLDECFHGGNRAIHFVCEAIKDDVLQEIQKNYGSVDYIPRPEPKKKHVSQTPKIKADYDNNQKVTSCTPIIKPPKKAIPKETPKKIKKSVERKKEKKVEIIEVLSDEEHSNLDSSPVIEAKEKPEKYGIANQIEEKPKIENDFVLPKHYTPERWELDVMDTLKDYRNGITNKLNEKHTQVNDETNKVVESCLNDVSSYIRLCDEELDNLNSSFVETYKRINSDIESKQLMVSDLGEQQKDHIEQMIKDCSMMQKKADEMLKRFALQKKNLIQNQEKHIALFREDIKSDVRSINTSKKRETSKKMVQKLVSLLDEL